MTSLDLPIRLVTQATNQDRAKNYEEAARCYREAIIGFRTVARGKHISPRVRVAINDKCALYEQRLKKLDRYLLSKADLSQLFRECVDYHQQQQRSSSSSPHSTDHSDDDSTNPNVLLRRGQDLIEKAKRHDAKQNFIEALKSYETGVELLMEAANCLTGSGPNSEAIRFKCLLIHDRINTIRNHLENGEDIQNRHDVFNVSFGSIISGGSIHGFDSCSVSPEPYVEESIEDRALLLEEIRSNLSASPSRRESVASSQHSLYPTVCEVRKAPMMATSVSEDDLRGRNSKQDRIPLIDINNSEFQLSTQSLDDIDNDECRRTRFISGGGSPHATSSLRSSLNDVHLLTTVEDSYERDCNVTELTYGNSGIDIDTYKAYCHMENHNNSSYIDSGSDSGHGSSIKGGSSTTRTPSNSPISINNDGIASPIAYEDSDDDNSLCRFPTGGGVTIQLAPVDVIAGRDGETTPPRRKSPEVTTSEFDGVAAMHDLSMSELTPLKSSSTSTPSSSPATRSSSLRRSTKRVDPAEADELRVVSTELIGDKSSEVYMPATKTSAAASAATVAANSRPEYIPPRALAYQPGAEDESPVNKGCFYLMACVDSFWVL